MISESKHFHNIFALLLKTVWKIWSCVFVLLLIRHWLAQEWPTNQRARTTFLTVLPQEPPHEHGQTWTSPHLFLSHTHTFAQLIYCKYHTTWKRRNFTSHLLSCTLVGLLVIKQKPHETGQKVSCGSRDTGWPSLVELIYIFMNRLVWLRKCLCKDFSILTNLLRLFLIWYFDADILCKIWGNVAHGAVDYWKHVFHSFNLLFVALRATIYIFSSKMYWKRFTVP